MVRFNENLGPQFALLHGIKIMKSFNALQSVHFIKVLTNFFYISPFLIFYNYYTKTFRVWLGPNQKSCEWGNFIVGANNATFFSVLLFSTRFQYKKILCSDNKLILINFQVRKLFELVKPVFRQNFQK